MVGGGVTGDIKYSGMVSTSSRLKNSPLNKYACIAAVQKSITNFVYEGVSGRANIYRNTNQELNDYLI